MPGTWRPAATSMASRSRLAVVRAAGMGVGGVGSASGMGAGAGMGWARVPPRGAWARAGLTTSKTWLHLGHLNRFVRAAPKRLSSYWKRAWQAGHTTIIEPP